MDGNPLTNKIPLIQKENKTNKKISKIAWKIKKLAFKLAIESPLLLNCMKSVNIWSSSGPYFSAYGLNTERYRVSVRIQCECGKIRTRKTPNTDTFHAMSYS